MNDSLKHQNKTIIEVKAKVARDTIIIRAAPEKSVEPTVKTMVLGTGAGGAACKILLFSLKTDVGTVTLTPWRFVTYTRVFLLVQVKSQKPFSPPLNTLMGPSKSGL